IYQSYETRLNVYPDELNARTASPLLVHFGTLFSILKKLNYSDVQLITYIEKFDVLFKKKSSENGINVTKRFEDEKCDQIADELVLNNSTKAVYMNSFHNFERCLFEAFQKKNITQKFQWISEHTNKYITSYNYDGFESIADGLIAINANYPETVNKSFVNYFENLRPENNRRNEWFKNFWQIHFGCGIQGNRNYLTKCSKSQKLEWSNNLNLAVVSVFNAVYSFAIAFKNAWKEKCGGNGLICESLRSMDSKTFFEDYVLKVQFFGSK
ncbi:metabotropic glutamate receptor-like protein, partial [Leptotrombidium deliense]